MTTHKDLPSGSQSWADEVAGYRDQILALEGIVRRMALDFGLDYANPARGLNTGNAPSIANPVMLKLPSLKDLDIRDAQDGDLLTFDGKRGVWVARAHDTVVLPKVFPEGDPASYYVAPTFTPANSWSTQISYTNLFLDPGLEASTAGWATSTQTNTNTSCTFALTSTAQAGSTGMAITYVNNSAIYPAQATAASYDGLPLNTSRISAWIQGRASAQVTTMLLIFGYSSGHRVAYSSGPVTAAAGVWQQKFVSGSSGLTSSIDGSPLEYVSMSIEVSDVTSAGSVVHVDELYAGTVSAPDSFNFNGSSPTGLKYLYSWNGTPNISTSRALQKSRIKTPASFPRGVPIQIIGAGFNPNEPIALSDGRGNTASATADGSGAFDARMSIAAASALGNTYIEALGTTSRAAYADVTVTA
jgi:hypothetical protein